MKFLRCFAVPALLMAVLLSDGGQTIKASDGLDSIHRDRLPTDFADPSWREAPVHTVELMPQDFLEPVLQEPSTASLSVRSVTDGSSMALLLVWEDDTDDNLPGGGRFSDACAIQVPASLDPDPPSEMMGEEGRPVEITYWRASWQSSVDGREVSIQTLYPNATIDHYPFEAPSLKPGSPEQRELESAYAPARALGRTTEGKRERSVQDLIAEGPGTLEPAEDQRSRGSGRRTASGWEVVIVRPLPRNLDPDGATQIAFSVWNGARGEVGGRKMWSLWVPLTLGGPK